MECIEYFHAMYRAASCHPPYRIHKTFDFYIILNQKLLSENRSRYFKNSYIWGKGPFDLNTIFTSFGSMIYCESKSMFVIYSTRSLCKIIIIYFLWKFYRTAFCISKWSLHLLHRNKKKLCQQHISPLFFCFFIGLQIESSENLSIL